MFLIFYTVAVIIYSELACASFLGKFRRAGAVDADVYDVIQNNAYRQGLVAWNRDSMVSHGCINAAEMELLCLVDTDLVDKAEEARDILLSHVDSRKAS